MKLKNVNGIKLCFEDNRTTYAKIDNQSASWAFINFDHVVYIGEEDSVEETELEIDY